MIAGYAKAGQVFKEKEYTDAAVTAADFVLTNMRDKKDGRLLPHLRGRRRARSRPRRAPRSSTTTPTSFTAC